jgi:hypothetical protein
LGTEGFKILADCFNLLLLKGFSLFLNNKKGAKGSFLKE